MSFGCLWQRTDSQICLAVFGCGCGSFGWLLTSLTATYHATFNISAMWLVKMFKSKFLLAEIQHWTLSVLVNMQGINTLKYAQMDQFGPKGLHLFHIRGIKLYMCNIYTFDIWFLFHFVYCTRLVQHQCESWKDSLRSLPRLLSTK